MAVGAVSFETPGAVLPRTAEGPRPGVGGLNSVGALSYWYCARAAVISAWIAGTCDSSTIKNSPKPRMSNCANVFGTQSECGCHDAAGARRHAALSAPSGASTRSSLVAGPGPPLL